MNKIFLIDKPKGITSHDVVDEVRRVTGERRVGHAGTLDPMATGLLIVLVGRGATKRQSEFMGLEKEYVAEITFGLEMDTYDAEGEVVNSVFGGEFLKAKLWDSPSPKRFGGAGRSLKLSFLPSPPESLLDLKDKDLEDALKEFQGKIKQQVPPYSAVKINGKPLYKYAREGRLDEVELPVREVEIKEIELLGFEKIRHSEDPDLSGDEESPVKQGNLITSGDSSPAVGTLAQNDRKGQCRHSERSPLAAQSQRGEPIEEFSAFQKDGRILQGSRMRSLKVSVIKNYLPKAKIRVVCSKGTYIRSLAHDLGQKLGTGAFLSALRRTRIGDYRSEKAVTLSQVEEAF